MVMEWLKEFVSAFNILYNTVKDEYTCTFS